MTYGSEGYQQQTPPRTDGSAGFAVLVALFMILGITAGIAAYVDLKDSTEALCASCEVRGSAAARAMLDAAAPWAVATVVAGVGMHISSRTR